jgi:ferredoxin-2, mitochondrial
MDNTTILIIIDRAGQSHLVPAPTDMSLNVMEVCRMSGLEVEGTCGGMALCASCQIYIESEHELDEPSDAELDMLDQAFHVRPNSRLGCQIRVTHELAGLTIRVAPTES